MRKIPLLVLLVLVLGASGCSTVQSRINEKQQVFAQLDPSTQDKIKKGDIDIGYTPDMVYMALGEPSEKKESVSQEGSTSKWVYYSYYERYEGTTFVGYRRQYVFNPKTQTYSVYYEPVHEDVYSEQRKEHIQVVFKNGRVTSIEQLKE
ncbi:MAG TPA: hypothetical protein VKC60_16465 [Opitutaceae bacterium]|nr:hypothetical protein [Opitutaceae bacterium]